MPVMPQMDVFSQDLIDRKHLCHNIFSRLDTGIYREMAKNVTIINNVTMTNILIQWRDGYG